VKSPGNEAGRCTRSSSDPQGVADSAWGLALAQSASGNPQEAIRYAEQALVGYRRLDDGFRIGWGVFELATLHFGEGRLDEAETYIQESLKIFAEANDRAGILLNLAGYALLANRRGQKVRELRIAGAARTLRASTGAGLLDLPIDSIQFVMPTEPPTDPDELRIWETGARMSAEEAADYALTNQDADKTELSAG